MIRSRHGKNIITLIFMFGVYDSMIVLRYFVFDVIPYFGNSRVFKFPIYFGIIKIIVKNILVILIV